MVILGTFLKMLLVIHKKLYGFTQTLNHRFLQIWNVQSKKCRMLSHYRFLCSNDQITILSHYIQM